MQSVIVTLIAAVIRVEPPQQQRVDEACTPPFCRAMMRGPCGKPYSGAWHARLKCLNAYPLSPSLAVAASPQPGRVANHPLLTDDTLNWNI
ncbi:protein of unknown function [Paraburkholderia kururiensis]